MQGTVLSGYREIRWGNKGKVVAQMSFVLIGKMRNKNGMPPSSALCPHCFDNGRSCRLTSAPFSPDPKHGLISLFNPELEADITF